MAVAAAALAAGVILYVTDLSQRLPEGLGRANGRIEAERIDIATKYAGRLGDVLVSEGSSVKEGDILAQLDTTEARTQLAAAQAQVHRAQSAVATAEAGVAQRTAELQLAEIEFGRVQTLVATAARSQAELDQQAAQRDVARAALSAAEVAVEDARAAVEVAEAQVAQIEAVIADMTLVAPAGGRIEYRLAQPGEVVGPGGRILTLLDLSDASMSLFLPTAQSGRVALGSEARIVLDGLPELVLPAEVVFVAAEAQFTPRYVETADEREKLMYRVELRIDPAAMEQAGDLVKAGMTGEGWVMLSPDAAWPEELAPRLPDASR